MNEVVWNRKNHDNGQLEYEIPYVNGKRHGVAKYYHTNGKFEHKIPWINGRLHGIKKIYYRDGTLRSEALWIRDNERNDLLGDEHRLERLMLLGGEYE